MTRWLFTLVLLACIASLNAQDRQLYIQRHKQIAIVEMHRTGIPASIKLAQGILESNAGASMLATKANNHFGLKCGGDWKGKTMMRKDDDRNARGELVKSCFRVFSSAEESYVAHSEFLADPNKEHRYGPLFQLPTNDYRAWAHGLKRAGYATNPKYPQLLIKIIEQYRLYEIDDEGLDMVVQGNDPVKLEKLEKKQAKKDKVITIGAQRAYPEKYHNGIRTVIAYGGDTPASISEQVGVKAKRIVKYNESIGSEYETFQKGQIIYLQPKRGKYTGAQEYHLVREGETMLSIADKYGIKVAKLYSKNGVLPGLQPAPGQKLTLKRKNKRTVKVLSHAHERAQSSGGEYLDELKPTSSQTPVDRPEVKQQVRDLATYIVQSSDTLYGIARRHGVSVSALKKLNNLRSDTIHPGQILKLEE